MVLIGHRVAVVAPGRDEESAEAAEVFAEVARQLLRVHLVPATLQRIVELAVEHLEACEFAGITSIEAGRITAINIAPR